MASDGLNGGRVAQSTQFAAIDGLHVKGMVAGTVCQLEVAGCHSIRQHQVKLEGAVVHRIVKHDAYLAGLACCKGDVLTAHAVTIAGYCGHTLRRIHRRRHDESGNQHDVGHRNVPITIHVSSLKNKRTRITLQYILCCEDDIGNVYSATIIHITWDISVHVKRRSNIRYTQFQILTGCK